jgi:hypothetical protein
LRTLVNKIIFVGTSMKRLTFVAMCLVASVKLPSTIALGADCHPACGNGQSCCVMTYWNGTSSAPYCRTGSCYTTRTNKALKEIDASTVDKQKADTTKDKKDAAASKAVAPK